MRLSNKHIIHSICPFIKKHETSASTAHNLSVPQDKTTNVHFKHNFSCILQNKVLNGSFRINAIQEPFLVAQRTFQSTVLILERIFFYFKESFVEWKCSADVKGSLLFLVTLFPVSLLFLEVHNRVDKRKTSIFGGLR